MIKSGWNHKYGPYSKKKEKKRIHKEGRFLKKSYDWLKWKITELGDFSYRRPSLENN